MSKFQSISLPTLSDSATMKEVENESRKMGLDILNKLNAVADAQYPVGYVYTQYPGTSDPATLFGGTWLNITSLYAGLFFRAEGGASLAFNAGNQLDAFQGHTHPVYVSSYIPASSTFTRVVGGTDAGGNPQHIPQSNPLDGPQSDTVNGTPRTASETRPVNTTIRIWQRSGGTLTTTAGTSVTSGIYDSGTNANGSWIRFTDGTMQCWGSTAGGSINTAYTTYFYFSANANLPQSFIDTNYNVQVQGAGAAPYSTHGQVNSVSQIGLEANASVNTYGFTAFKWLCTGKWK